NRIKEIALRERKLTETLAQYEALSQELNIKKKEIIEKAKSEASHLLKETNREIEKTIRHIRENKAERKETRKVRDGLQDMIQKVKPEIHVRTQTDKIEMGDYVRLIGQEVSGKVISIKEDVALVQFGDLRSQVKIRKLIRSDQAISNPAFARIKTSGLDISRKQSLFVNTLDIRGKRVEEVNSALDQFIDDAILLGQTEIKILHGKGEGVLRKVVRERLKGNKSIASVADEHVERGGDGITIVILK
ncbi:MAG: Smr/MutS family protein, partial [Cyclobacteriaceae bacterium]|nr:Smr/MutS family protein [Cyclobacteriaceae bacterium]